MYAMSWGMCSGDSECSHRFVTGIIVLRFSCNRNVYEVNSDSGFLKCGHCTCEAVRPLMVGVEATVWGYRGQLMNSNKIK